MGNIFYITDNSFMTTLSWVITLSLAIYLFTKSRRNVAALTLGIYCLFFSVVWAGWTFRHMVTPLWGDRYFYFTWSVFLGFVAQVQFAYRFPKHNTYPREAWVVLVITGLMAVLGYVDFYFKFPKVAALYEFESHSYVKKFGLQGLIYIVMLIWSIVVGIRKTLHHGLDPEFLKQALQKPERFFSGGTIKYLGAKFLAGWIKYFHPRNVEARGARNFGVAILLGMVIGLLQLMARENHISLEINYILKPLTIVALFLYGLFFINYSGVASSFMFKVMGISLTAFLIIFSFIGKLYFAESEASYDYARVTEVKAYKRALQSGLRDAVPPGARYVLAYSINNDLVGNDFSLEFAADPSITPAEFKGYPEPYRKRRRQLNERSAKRAEKGLSPEQLAHKVSLMENQYRRTEYTRKYRQGPGIRRYTHFEFQLGERLYEVGYDYYGYRQYIHERGLKLMWLLLGSVATVLFLFPIFFRDSLIRPLKDLLAGVERVNQGDLDTQVTVGIEDEIGFLASGFNNMVVSVRTAHDKLANYAEDLEAGVQKRTRALTRAMEKVKSLKSKQDGDYFLTSLLLKPMITNDNNSLSIHTEMHLEQKKKFSFRKFKSQQLGGDYCMTDNIRLMGRDFVFFINADAMGKSVQGAGGALVLASSLKSFLEDLKSQGDADEPPELWLHKLYAHLQGLFVTFDGSMFASAVLGLVDEGNGVLYYINIEHPWTVLMRGGSASFLDEDVEIRKLGVPADTLQFRVKTFALEPDDRLLMGSDGRDDIIMDTAGEDLMNEDEGLFRELAEKSSGDLTELSALIKSRGRLTDDISLLSIHYEPGADAPPRQSSDETRVLLAEPQRLYKEQKYQECLEKLKVDAPTADWPGAALKLAGKAHLKLREFQEARGCLLRSWELSPLDSNICLLIASIENRNGRRNAAIRWAETTLLRTPNNPRAVEMLGELYRRRDEKESELLNLSKE